MKKLILIGVFAVASLTLFSFRTVDVGSRKSKVIDLGAFNAGSTTSFIQYRQVFPSHFREWKQIWTVSSSNSSLDEFNATLKEF